MAKLIYNFVTFADIAAMDLKGHPFLHEQGQVVLRGFVQSLDISEETWSLCARDIDFLQKYTGTWTREDPGTYGGPIKGTSFSRCRVEQRPGTEVSAHISCYGMLFHIGARLEDPWRDNLWPQLDTDFLPSDLVTSDTPN